MSNLPPGCSVNDIPGNSREDIEYENKLNAIWHLCQAAVPGLFAKNNDDIGFLGMDQEEALIDAIANALDVAFEGGYALGAKHKDSNEE